MKVAFLRSDKPREGDIAAAFLAGVALHGHQVAEVVMPADVEPGKFDVIAMFGVKNRNRFRAHRAAGSHVVYLDKGYVRYRSISGLWEYCRVAIDAHQPTSRLFGRELPPDRWEELGLTLKPWRESGDHVVIAGSSAKYHAFHGIIEPEAYAKQLVADIRRHTGREIVYRPKPTYKAAQPIEGTRFGYNETLTTTLSNAWAVVTHGSSACFEAMLAGIPCIITGNAIAKPISSTDLSQIEAPRLATDTERLKLMQNLAWYQWRLPEFRSGEAWAFLEQELSAPA